jgi:hypothetical protein
MKTHPPCAALIIGTTAIFSVQLFGAFNFSQPSGLKHSRDLGILTSVFGSLPANAQSIAPSVSLGGKEFLLSQATSSPIRFVPPSGKSTRRSQGSGSRGCEQSLPGDLVTLLIPSKDYIGQTTSGHPSFFWYLSQPVSVPLKFTLVERGVPEPLLVKQIDSVEVGMIKVEFPKDKPELAVGRVYSWSVTLQCNARRPSANPYFYSWIERIPTTPVLAQQLADVSSRNNLLRKTVSSESASPEHDASAQALRDRAAIYAQFGLWYDALDALWSAQKVNPNDGSIKEDFLALLKQVSLEDVAKQEQQRLAHN